MVGVSIPLSVLFAVVLMYFTGLDLNVMTPVSYTHLRTPPGICILVCILTKQAGKGKTNRAATTTK